MALTQDHEAIAATDARWPTVCVVIPTRGRKDLVRQAVESVVRQDYRGDIDILVVHDHEEPQHELTGLAGPGSTCHAADQHAHRGLGRLAQHRS